MRSQLSLLVLLTFALAALAAVRRSGPAAPQPAFHRARRAVSDYPNPLIAKRQVKADSIRAPSKAKRACPSGLPSCECNPACSADQVCQFGTCVSACDTSTGEYEDCNGICINVLSNDNNNCGACGFTCPSNRPICDGGVCACDTANGYVDCETICTPVSDFQTDPYNCGGCQVMPYCIGTGQVCQGGSCICDASEGYELCDETCTPISDYQTELNNCGSCGHFCPPQTTCQNGICTCGTAGLTICGEMCVDTTSDSENCGTCSTICYNDMVCVNSACECPDGYMDCDGNCIYVDDNENCGTCGNLCQSGFSCTNGQCLCADLSQVLCQDGTCAAPGTCTSFGAIAAYSGEDFIGYLAFYGAISEVSATRDSLYTRVYATIGSGPGSIYTELSTDVGVSSSYDDWAVDPSNSYGTVNGGLVEQNFPGSGPLNDGSGGDYTWTETSIWTVSSVYTSNGYAITGQWVDDGEGATLLLSFVYEPVSPTDGNSFWAVAYPTTFMSGNPLYEEVTLWFQYNVV